MLAGIIASVAVSAMAAARNASQPFAVRDRTPPRTISRRAPPNRTPVGTKTGFITALPLSAAERREDHDSVIGRQWRFETLHSAHVVPIDEDDDEVPQIAILQYPALELVPVLRHQGPHQVSERRLRLVPVFLFFVGDVPEERKIFNFHRSYRASGIPDNAMH